MVALTGHGLQDLLAILAHFGTIVQLVVLATLALASVGSWAIILHKVRLFRRAQRDSQRFLRAMQTGEDLAFVAAAARRFAASPLARLFRAVHHQLETPSRGPRLDGGPAAADLDPLRQTLRQAQAEELVRLERGLPFLATTASAAPFVGLFGTVWGIMQAFHAIGKGSGASLAVVGPGISEALIATAAGLAAAIPAVVAYNHFLHRLRRWEGELEHFAAELVLLAERAGQRATLPATGRSPLPR
ncbi:MAG: Tol-Pal system subunit TolQ [Candidatus Tectimicrobiota bacterium]|nr:MAG: Tol-Pal system subunit TolQ [Candidatus Tectomicrobia bacterium]